MAGLPFYIVKRVALLLPLLLLLSLLVFLMVRLVPGDPAVVILGPRATPARLDEVRRLLGLDQPLLTQYWHWLSRALGGDFGRSIQAAEPVSATIMARLPATLELGISSLVLAVLAGVPLGVLAAARRNSALDRLSMLAAVLGQSMPVFWLGLLLIYFFSYRLGWLPFSGRIDSTMAFVPISGFYLLDSLLTGNLPALRNALAHLALPALALALLQMALITRITRSAVLEALSQEYIRTARAKGLADRAVLYRHALRNALIPVVTVLGLEIGSLLGGAVLTETVFAWPGLGRLMVDSVFSRDYPVVQATVFVFGLVFMLSNLVVDIAYAAIDPRVTYG